MIAAPAAMHASASAAISAGWIGTFGFLVFGVTPLIAHSMMTGCTPHHSKRAVHDPDGRCFDLLASRDGRWNRSERTLAAVGRPARPPGPAWRADPSRGRCAFPASASRARRRARLSGHLGADAGVTGPAAVPALL